MSFKILHHFVGDSGILREIKYFDEKTSLQPVVQTKTEIKQPIKLEVNVKKQLIQPSIWQWTAFGYKILILNLKFIEKNKVVFKEGVLEFNNSYGVFTINGKTYQLKRTK